MKKIALAALGVFVVAGLSTYLIAASGNPTSNVLYDTSNTASTLVMRDSNGNITVNTADIAASAVTTSKFWLDLRSATATCVTSQQKLGICSSAVDANGRCTCAAL